MLGRGERNDCFRIEREAIRLAFYFVWMVQFEIWFPRRIREWC